MKKIIHAILLTAASLSIGNWMILMVLSMYAELTTKVFFWSSIAGIVSQFYLMLFFIINLPEIK